MKHDRQEIKDGLKKILADQTTRSHSRTIAREALELIRTMEADLRRQGFTDYTDDKDTQ